MRKFSTICLSLLMAASIQVSATSKTTVGQNFPKRQLPMVPVSVPGMTMSPEAKQLKEAGFFAGVKNAPTRVTDDPATQVADSYGWVLGPNGYYWHYTMDFTTALVPREDDYKEYKYTGASIKVYDNNNKEVGAFQVSVPDTMKCNNIQLYGPITKKLFDLNDQTYEIMCQLHHAVPGSNYYITRAYSIQTGDIEFERKGTGYIFDASRNSYDIYQRFIMTEEDVVKDGKEYTNIDIYKPSPYSADHKVELEKNIVLDQSHLYYMQGSYLNCYAIDGEPYYVISQFNEPWELSKDPTNPANVIQRQDNPLIIKTYAMVRPEGKYWKELTMVDSVAIMGNTPEGWQFRELGFGTFPYGDLNFTKGYFSGDDQFNYVVLACDYSASKGDSDFATFDVYNSKGEKIKQIIKEASSEWWKAMAAVPGKEDQVAFLQTIGDGDAAADQITMVDLPSCEQVAVLPYSVEGNLISTTLDRKASSKNSYGYQYVVSLSQGESDSEGNVIAPIVWINPNGGIDHKDAMNLGPNGMYFTPLLNETTLNPYIFDTSDDMEYIYLCKKMRTDGSKKIDNIMEIAKADGTVLKSFESNEDRRIIEPSLVPVNADGKYQLAIAYQNNNTERYEMEFCDLPLNKFAEGGKGTKEEPYLVSTTGDLMQMGQNKKAYYKLANDIDMTEGGLWTPIDNFQGELDGDGHALFNMYIAGKTARTGLFATMGYGGHAKNLNFVNPTIELNTNSAFVGVLAGECAADSLNGAMKVIPADSIHVINGKITGNYGGVIGGIIGQTTLYGDVVACSFQGEINAPNATEGVGGIVGKNYTGSRVYACSANLTATIGENLGGILGVMSKNCGAVYDCESQGKLTAKNQVGGIIGSDAERVMVKNCVSRADIYATSPDKFVKYAAGGIVGALEADPYATDKTVAGSSSVVYNNVATGNIYVNGVKFDGTDAKENCVHAVVGSSSNDVVYGTDEKYDETKDEWIVTPTSYAVEGGLRNNYTTINLTTNTDANTSEGKYMALGSLNQNFFKGLSFAYGSNAAAPWKGNQVPVMWYDGEPKAITISAEDATLGLNLPDTYIKVVVYGIEDAEDIEVSAQNPKVAEVSVESIDGNEVTLKVHALKTGFTTVNVSYAGLSTSCTVTVMKEIVNGIENVAAASDFKVSMANGYISAEGAKTINVYSVGGQLIAKSNGTAISTAQLAKGIYVVYAISASGQKSTAKFVVK